MTARASGQTRAPALRFEILVLLADYEFCLAHFFAAESAVVEAERLLPLVPHHDLDVASLAWTKAELDRRRGLSWQLLPALWRVAATYVRLVPVISQGRLRYFLAEVALDAAEQAAQDPSRCPITRSNALAEATHFLQLADQLTLDAQNPKG